MTKRNAQPRIVDLLERYTRRLQSENTAPRTIKRYCGAVRQFAFWLDDDAYLDDISEDLINDYLDELTGAGQSPRTRALTISAIRSFCRWAIRTKLRADDPTLFIRRPRIKRGLSRALRAEELDMLAQALETFIPGRGRSRWMWRRNCLCISLCLYAGLRIEEVRSLAWELNIDLAMQTINVIGKGEKPREVPIPSILLKELEQIPPHERKGAVIGLRNGAHLDERSIGKIFGRWLPSIGVEGVTAHRLRHTYAKELLDQGVALEVIQALLGHEDPETTLIYVGGPSIERLRKSVECLQAMTKMRRRKRVEIVSY